MARTLALKAAAVLGAGAYCLVLLASKDTPTDTASVIGAASLVTMMISVASLWMAPEETDPDAGAGKDEDGAQPTRLA